MTDIISLVFFCVILFISISTLLGLLHLSRFFISSTDKEVIKDYITMLEVSPFPAIIFRFSDMSIMALNDQAAFLFRTLKEKMISRKILDYFEEPGDLHTILPTLKKEGKVTDYETRCISREGKIIWVLLSANLIRINDDDAVIIAFVDMTTQKQLEMTLQKNKELYRSFVRTSPDNITLVDMLGRIFMVSPAAFTMFGYSIQDRYPYGLPFIDQIHPEDIPRFKHDMRQLKTGKKPGINEYRAVRKDGSVIFIESHSSIVLDAQGRPDAILFIIRDITRRKEAEKALKENEERFITIFEEVPDPILIFHRDGTIIDMNRQFEEWFDLGKRCSIGYKIQKLKLFKTDTDNVDQFGKILSLQPGEKYDTSITHSDGTERYAILSTRSITINGDEAVLLLINDIDSLTRTNKALTTANYQVNLLNSITRHDILNKVMAITGYSELLLDEIHEDTNRDYITTIFHSGKDIQHLIEFTREYQDLGVHEPKWQNINHITNKRIIKALLTGISLSVSDGSIEIYADQMLEKVMYNLIENSIRHGGTVTKISISYEMHDDSCTVIYSDDGVGVAESEKHLIFNKGHGKNSGLGLFLISEILRLTGITIIENGIAGKGVRFELIVPAKSWRYVKSSKLPAIPFN